MARGTPVVTCEDLSMANRVDLNGVPFHFIGVGGIGMSALAYILARRNLPVAGSDIHLNQITQKLQALGVRIFGEQVPTNLDYFCLSTGDRTPEMSTGISALDIIAPSTAAIAPTATCQAALALPQVVCSSAISHTNAEYRAALDLGCSIFHRSDLLAALLQEYDGIAVGGTHGKTTTSSLIGHLLLDAGLDPTIVVGGEVSTWGGNARLGQGSYLVAEADESDGSLVKFGAHIGVITNIELDHPDHYRSLEQVIKTFQQFAQQCRHLVACLDCQTIQTVLEPSVSYSLQPHGTADYWVDRVTYESNRTTARVWERGQVLGYLELQLLGSHNLSNALAAVAVGRLVGLDFTTIHQAIATFPGARRRFELYGEYQGIRFIDDYAHHPSEIQATLRAARIQAQTGRVIAVFQPHRYSRTAAFLDQFARCFEDADIVISSEIYGAGEANLVQLDGQQVAEAIARYHPHVHYQSSLSAVQVCLRELLHPGDTVIFLGAGNLNRIIPDVMAVYQEIQPLPVLSTPAYSRD